MTYRPLSPDTALVRAPDLRIRLRSSGKGTIWVDGRSVLASPHSLTLLDAFASPRKVKEVIDELSVRGIRDYIDLTSTLLRMRQEGVLLDALSTLPPPASTSAYDASPIHARMLRDTTRTRAFIEALNAVVRPGDVVLDIGTGTGVLAIAAARAGARRVYAIEASGIAERAEEIVRRNGLADRIEIVRGWSTRVELPERCDVLVTEMIGDEPLGEHTVDIVHDARRRFLREDCRIVPSRVRVYARLATMPTEIASRHFFVDENLERFQRLYAIDFAPMREAELSTDLSIKLGAEEVRAFTWRSEPFLLTEVDLGSSELTFTREVEARASSTGLVNAVVVHFELDLAPSVKLDHDPLSVDEDNHWGYLTWLPRGPRTINAGAKVGVRYRYADGVALLTLQP